MAKAWKALEYKTAELLGGKRVIRTSYGDKDTDVKIEDFPNFKLDCKRRKKLYVYSLWDKIKEKYCDSGNDEPVLILREHNRKDKLAVIDLKLLAKLLDFVREKGGTDVFH